MKLTNRLHNIQMDAPKTVKYENKRLSTLGPHIWNSLSKHFKAENDFSKFKKYVSQRFLANFQICVSI